MKTAVKIITVVALLMIMAGGAALDGENISVPMLVITPALAWFGALALVNR